jgi:hypothetical protein
MVFANHAGIGKFARGKFHLPQRVEGENHAFCRFIGPLRSAPPGR